MNVKQIVAERLKVDGFDGLVSDDGCGCGLEEFAPCGEMRESCEAAYKWTPEQAAKKGIEVEEDYQDYAFIMYPEKPPVGGQDG